MLTKSMGLLIFLEPFYTLFSALASCLVAELSLVLLRA